MRTRVLIFVILLSNSAFAGEAEYKPGGPQFRKVWQQFYHGDHEPELDDPLIKAGRKMTLAICEAVAHQDMKMRRYAIGALGYIGDRRAIPQLESILKNKEELDYFRGDALHSIYQLDRELGTRYATHYENENDYLRMISGAIKRQEPWLLEPTEEQ
jgi:PBS lyase HEAT-like repeat-containing protein